MNKSSLLKNRIFIRVFSVNLLSNIGDRLLLFILPLWIMETTNSSFFVSIINAITTVVTVLLTPLTGTFADRSSRRKLMVLGDIIRLLVMLALGIVTFYTQFHFGILLLLMVIRSLGTSIYSPASNASLLTFVEKEHINQAVAWRQTMMQIAGVVAPLLGGILVAIYNYELIFFIDAASFLLSVIVLLTVKFPNDIQVKIPKPFWHDLKEGINVVTNDRLIKILLFFACLINILGAALTVAIQVSVVRMDLGSLWWGIIFVSSPIGMIVGSMSSKIFKLNTQTISNAFIFASIMGAFNVLMGFTTLNPYIFSLMFFLSGYAFGLSNVYFGTLYQKLIPLDKQGRFFGFLNSLLLIATPIGQTLTGGGLEILSEHIFIVFIGLLTVIVGLYSLFYLKKTKVI
ncbi:MFS transporter [Paenibacillus ihbetae]|uniref:Major facilitator superfamily (MFS) profile domain-containing protein n=1 Tax=Paenibacillus ihbetae TaxID=1870820 RepID=A0ABX3JW94_9BACL|nr:MFS transporter [Paenibacillus ihbetae]OOC61630.1 hypothetical protein BBD40_07015 [Paenibacillus ihbetae]